jgi:hypothetical protein
MGKEPFFPPDAYAFNKDAPRGCRGEGGYIIFVPKTPKRYYFSKRVNFSPPIYSLKCPKKTPFNCRFAIQSLV